MNVEFFNTYERLSVETAQRVAELLSQKPDALLCFPAGETSMGTFKELVKMQEEGKADFSSCRIVGLDEWCGLGEWKNENCFHFLQKNLFAPLKIRNEQLHFFNGEASDLVEECASTEAFILNQGGIDLMLLGMGMNGHLGLNEPGTGSHLRSHVVELDATTRSVGQKYFSGTVQLTKGITLGMKNIMEARLVILQVSGSHKAAVLERLMTGRVSDDFPASRLWEHGNAVVMSAV